MSMTAKVFVTSKIRGTDGQTNITLAANYDNGANKEWAKYTPSLSLSMTVLDEVAEQFGNYGSPYTLTFEPEVKE